MKKSLVLALGLAAPLFAGEAPMAQTPIITPVPPTCCPLSMEAAAGYGHAMGDIFDDASGSKSIDVYTADITAVYTFTPNHSANLRLGYSFGDECYRGPSSLGTGGALVTETDVHTFSIMPGYRYTHEINEKWSAFIGANMGVANVSVKDWACPAGATAPTKVHDSDWGFAWSVEIGAKYKMSSNWSLFGTLGLFGNTAEPVVGAGVRPVDQQWYSGVRLGVGYEF